MSTPPQLPERSQIVQRALADAGLTATVREMSGSTRTAADAAATLGCDIGAIGSSLLFLSDGGPVLVVASSKHRVDTDLVGRQLGVHQMTLAPAQQVRDITGQAIGGVAPVGHLTPLRTAIDIDLIHHNPIWVAAGTPNTVVPLTFDELVRVTNGKAVWASSD